MEKFRSLSEKVNHLIKEYLTGANVEVSKKEIFAYLSVYVTEEERRKLTATLVDTVIKKMLITGELIRTGRARYKKGLLDENISLQDKVLILTDMFKNGLKKISVVNVLDVSPEEIEFVQSVHRLELQFEKELMKLIDHNRKENPASPS